MIWIKTLSKAIDYIESNLDNEISIDEISRQGISSSSHFQLIFHLVTGLTVGEYIRNRRLSLAAEDLLIPGSKVIEVAMRYQYDTPESFSKAFVRFHGVAPSKIKREQVRTFNPFTINISIQGGFEMSWKIADEFHMLDWKEVKEQKELSPEEKYKRIISWAGKARGRNPKVFDALCDWLMNDDDWTEDKLAENKEILMQGVLARFKEQNARLRTYLKELEPSGVVNFPVFKALDDFDKMLNGEKNGYWECKETAKMFADFSVMSNRNMREKIAGGKTGRQGVDTAGPLGLGYIGYLKDGDASVQWCLFMPDMAKNQQKGFQVDSFEYKLLPALRFIGIEDSNWHSETAEEYYIKKEAGIKKITETLDRLAEYNSEFDYDVLFQHHYGKGVDVEPCHGFWGRFMKADTPVPEGFVHFDLLPDDTDTTHLTFRSQFAYAKFSGDIDAMKSTEGFDGCGMYDVTRNIILGQNIRIPYPETYWTAEVFLNGFEKPTTAYMFSVMFSVVL